MSLPTKKINSRNCVCVCCFRCRHLYDEVKLFRSSWTLNAYDPDIDARCSCSGFCRHQLYFFSVAFAFCVFALRFDKVLGHIVLCRHLSFLRSRTFLHAWQFVLLGSWIAHFHSASASLSSRHSIFLSTELLCELIGKWIPTSDIIPNKNKTDATRSGRRGRCGVCAKRVAIFTYRFGLIFHVDCNKYD